MHGLTELPQSNTPTLNFLKPRFSPYPFPRFSSPPFSFPSTSCNVGLNFKVNYSVLQIVLGLFLKHVSEKHPFHWFLFSFKIVLSLLWVIGSLFSNASSSFPLEFRATFFISSCEAVLFCSTAVKVFLHQTFFLCISKLVKRKFGFSRVWMC